jgi:hypothetical protein
VATRFNQVGRNRENVDLSVDGTSCFDHNVRTWSRDHLLGWVKVRQGGLVCAKQLQRGEAIYRVSKSPLQ